MPPGGSASGEPADRELVKVAYARDPIEGALAKGLLEDAGIPCLLESSGMKVDGPQLGFGFLARGWGGGPQDVLVHSGRAQEARAIIAQTEIEDRLHSPADRALEDAEAGGRKPRDYSVLGAYFRASVAAIAVFALILGAFLLFRAI